MKVTLTYNDPIKQGNQVIKSWMFPDKNEKILRDLMTKFNGEGLTILPVEIESQYPDGSKETVLVMISSLCGKNNRVINKHVIVKPNTNCTESMGVLINEKKSITDRIKNWFRY